MESCILVLEVFTLVILILVLLYKYLTKNFDFWEKQNVSYVMPRVLLGSYSLGKKQLHELENDLYQTYGRIYGRFDGSVPVLSVADPELLKRIFVKDFHIFPNRRDLKFNDPIMDNSLFIIEGESWKRLRKIVSSTFTSAKLKKMFPLLQECSDILLKNLTASARTQKTVDCQRVFGAFTMDSIARCAFGMNIDSLHSNDDPFVAEAKKMLQCFMSWRTVLTMLFPKLMKLFHISLLNPETTKFYKNIMLEVIEKRNKDHVNRNDFLQLLLDAECETTDSNNNTATTSNGNVHMKDSISDMAQESKSTSNNGLSLNELVAQCITFFMAGYDATTSLLCHAIYNLAMHQHYQEQVHNEVLTAINKNNGKLNYEALSEMKFMDAILNECLRLCPTVIRSERRAEDDYVMGDTNIVVKKGTLVSIPVYAIHRDPEWYPDPEAFRPERFLSGNSDRPQYVHLPFGAGPRICIGMRFAQIQVKMCLANVVKRFRVRPAPGTPDKLGYTETRGILKVNDVEVFLVERCVK